MASFDLKTYLGHYYAGKGVNPTHTSIKGGTYLMTDEEQFLECYYNDVIVNKKEEYLTEKQLSGDDKRLVVDLDLRYSTDITTRQHTPEHIEDVIYIYCDLIQEICILPDGFRLEVFIMEKDDVNILDDKTKDGIHLIFGICLNADMQLLLREL